MKKLVIVGNTSNAKLAHYYFTNDSEYEIVAFSVNKDFIKESEFCGLPVVALEEITEIYPPNDYDAFIAVGYTKMNSVREKLYELTNVKLCMM